MSDKQLWLDDPTRLAIELDARAARRWLSAPLIVPSGCAALIGDQLLPAGATRERAEPLVLIKEAPFTIDLAAVELASADGHALGAELTLSLMVDLTDIASARPLRATVRSGELTTEEVAYGLRPALQSGLASACKPHSAEALLAIDPAALEAPLREAAAAALALRGLALSRIRRLDLTCPTLEAARREAAEAQAAADAAAARQRTLEIWEKDQKNEALTQAEVREFYANLEREGQIKQLQARDELDDIVASYERERAQRQQALSHTLQQAELQHKLALDRTAFEEELLRTKRAAEVLEGADMGALIGNIEDDAAREKLYSMLIQKEMTPDQLRALEPKQEMQQQLQAMQAQLAAVAEKLSASEAELAQLASKKTDDTRTERVLIASGERVLAFDPHSNIDADRPRETYDGKGELGGIRSVRVASDAEGKRWLLAGAQGGVYAWPVGQAVAEPRRYRIDRQASGRTGINAIALSADGGLWATHSEHGLLRWRWDAPDYPQQHLHEPLTASASAVRALIPLGDNELAFACDARVYRFDPTQLDTTQPGHAPTLYTGPTAQVSALAWAGGRLLASTVAGAVYAWRPGDPHSPSIIYSRQAKIYLARPAVVAGVDHLFLGSKDTAVVCRSLEGNLETSYQAGGLVRWADGASDIACAVDYDGHQLILWRAELPDTELRRIPVADPITDLWLLRA